MRLKVLIVLTLIFNVLFCSHSKTSPSHLRALQNSKEERACSLLIAIDELLFNHYQRNFTRITNLVQVLVTGANDIYAKDIFLGQFEGIYFRVKEIRLLFNFCPHCNQTARNFLDTFALMDFSDFCLAHLLTYRDFPDGLQGMAHRGALCSRNQNTGFTSLLNHGVQTQIEDSVITFSHELGHNFGADHDENQGCSSKYIMAALAVDGNLNRFSTCSKKLILTHLSNRLSSRRYSNCLQPISKSQSEPISFCGNGIVEGSEQCDCGLDYTECTDPCCYPAELDPEDRRLNSSASPCRWNEKPLCLKQWDPLWKFGLVAPWFFIICVVIILSLALCFDWHHKRKCFTHQSSGPENMEERDHQIQVTQLKPDTSPVPGHPGPSFPIKRNPPQTLSQQPFLIPSPNHLKPRPNRPAPRLPTVATPRSPNLRPILPPLNLHRGQWDLGISPRAIQPPFATNFSNFRPVLRPTPNVSLVLPINQRPPKLPNRLDKRFK